MQRRPWPGAGRWPRRPPPARPAALSHASRLSRHGQQPEVRHLPPGLRPAVATGFGPGFNGPLILVGGNVPTAPPIRRCSPGSVRTRRRRGRGVASVDPGRAEPRRQTPPSSQVIPDDRRPRTSRPPTSSNSSATSDPRGSRRGTGRRGARRRGHRRRRSTSRSYISDRLPLFIGAVLAPVVPAADGRVPVASSCRSRRSIMNLLSIGAAYGVVVRGVPAGLGRAASSGSADPSPIESFVRR